MGEGSGLHDVGVEGVKNSFKKPLERKLKTSRFTVRFGTERLLKGETGQARAREKEAVKNFKKSLAVNRKDSRFTVPLATGRKQRGGRLKRV